MRITIESFRNPFSSHIFSTFPINTGKYWTKVRDNVKEQRVTANIHVLIQPWRVLIPAKRRASIPLSDWFNGERNIPHVGNATHADDDNLKPL
jgi:hypothetical protein